MKQRILKNRILLLALALLLLIPMSITLAKYTTVNEVGTVALNIRVYPVLQERVSNLLNRECPNATKLVVGSFNKESPALPEETDWGDGIYCGYSAAVDSTKDVRLFTSEDGATAYILAKGDNAVVFPEESRFMFFKLTNLQEIQFNKIDTSNATDMYAMFAYSSSLKALDLSSFDTQNVIHMNLMFFRCSSLERLDLSSFDTGNVENMGDMFDFGAERKLSWLRLGAKFRFVPTGVDLAVGLRNPDPADIPGSDGYWHLDSVTRFEDTTPDLANYQNSVTETTTYYAVPADAPEAAAGTGYSLRSAAAAPDPDDDLSGGQNLTDDPVTPVDPAAPVDPINPVTPVDPAAPIDPVNPVTPVDPTDPEDPADPDDPVTTGEETGTGASQDNPTTTE